MDEKEFFDAIATRVFEFTEQEGLSNTDFANTIDIGTAIVSHLKNKRNNISLNVYAKILDSFPKLNPDWLLFGSGTMYRETNVLPTKTENLKPDLFSSPILQNVEASSTATKVIEEEKGKSEENTPTKADKREVSKVLLLYTDGSFQEFNP